MRPPHWKRSKIGLLGGSPSPRKTGMSARHPLSQLLLATVPLGAICAGGSAAAQTYSIGPGSAPLGTVASDASGPTIFTINSVDGTVTKVTGNGGRVSTGAANATVTIGCSGGSCGSKNVNVRVAITGSPTGRAGSITAFNVTSGTATVSNLNTSTPTNIRFTLNPIPNGASRTFKLGMTFPIGDNASGAAGNASASYYVSAVAANSTPPTTGPSGSMTAFVYRSLSVVKNSDYNFGRIVRPRTGVGHAILNGNGTRTTDGGVVWLTSPFPTRASYLVTGDGGKQLAITADPFDMYRAGGGSVTVTPIIYGSATPSLSGGATGTYNLFLGGSVEISSTTPSGTYTGSFNVTVAYN